MFEFNDQGNLKGNSVYEIDIDSFEKEFVIKIKNSSTRILLFDSFKKLIIEVKKTIDSDFYIIVDRANAFKNFVNMNKNSILAR
jgi:hypothetical protein